jgi:hypothetical protein
MTPRTVAPRGGARRVGPSLFLAAAGAFFGYLIVPHSADVFLVVWAGVALGIGLRWVREIRAQQVAAVPVLVALATGAVASPLGIIPELAAGGSALAFLLWLAEDPARPAGGPARARVTILIPAFALGIAWASALLLPSNSASIGVAAGLLVFVIAALAYLVGRPGLFDREAATTS